MPVWGSGVWAPGVWAPGVWEGMAENRMTASPGAFALTGIDADLAHVTGGHNLFCETGVFRLSGKHVRLIPVPALTAGNRRPMNTSFSTRRVRAGVHST